MTWLSMGPWLAGALTMLACFMTGWELQASRLVPAPACAATAPISGPSPPSVAADSIQADGGSWQRWPRTTDF